MSITIGPVPLEQVWQMRQEVMYPELSIDAVKLEDDAAGEHLGLYVDDSLCSVVSLFRQGDVLQFRKFATLQAQQGKGLGTKLLQHVFERAQREGVKKIWCNSRLSASGFYERFGMQPFGEPWNDLGHRFIKMQIEL